jgi:hypothetical protein
VNFSGVHGYSQLKGIFSVIGVMVGEKPVEHGDESAKQ